VIAFRAREGSNQEALQGSSLKKRTVPNGAAELVYGLRAGLAVLAVRPRDVLRVDHGALDRDAESALNRARAAGVQVAPAQGAELERLAGSKNHEGLCVTTKPRAHASLAALADTLVATKGLAVALDRVRNPYNVGAIVRSAAFFGARAIVLGSPAPHPGLAPDAVRVAEGGAEHLLVARTTDLSQTLAGLRARGVGVVGAEMTAKADAASFRFPRPCVLVVGNEREGLHERVRATCDASISIRGTGAIESLNVAAAAAVLIAYASRV